MVLILIFNANPFFVRNYKSPDKSSPPRKRQDFAGRQWLDINQLFTQQKMHRTEQNRTKKIKSLKHKNAYVAAHRLSLVQRTYYFDYH
jgi:hypothetical protein